MVFAHFLSTLISKLKKGSRSQGEFREFFEKKLRKDTRLKTKDQKRREKGKSFLATDPHELTQKKSRIAQI